MKLISSIKINRKYNIDEVKGDKCLVTFIDLKSEQKEENQYEDNTIIEYKYNAYQIELMHNEESIKSNYDIFLNLAKDFEYNKIAEEVREKRNRLLEESDNECLSDRNPSKEMLAYRQALRDITKQDGFPYDVVFPIKP